MACHILYILSTSFNYMFPFVSTNVKHSSQSFCAHHHLLQVKSPSMLEQEPHSQVDVLDDQFRPKLLMCCCAHANPSTLCKRRSSTHRNSQNVVCISSKYINCVQLSKAIIQYFIGMLLELCVQFFNHKNRQGRPFGRWWPLDLPRNLGHSQIAWPLEEKRWGKPGKPWVKVTWENRVNKPQLYSGGRSFWHHEYLDFDWALEELCH